MNIFVLSFFINGKKGEVLAFTKCLAEELKKKESDLKINIFFPGMINTNLYNTAKVIETWKDQETYQREMDIVLKYAMTDIEESCSKIIPYALPSCSTNGKIFRGFSVMKLIKGFKKISKEMKNME